MKRRGGFFIFALFILILPVLAGCGKEGDSSPPSAGNPPADDTPGGNLPSTKISRIEITPEGALLTVSGDSAQLSAQAYDADGNVVAVPITWRSTKATAVSVDDDGLVTAHTDNGSSQIIAEAGGVSSAPVLAVVTPLPSGVVLLTDAQIVGDPVVTDPTAPPSFTGTYRIVLSGVSAPAVGSLLINTESKPVVGRVVAVETTGGETTVTLGLVSLPEAFPHLNIREVIDLSQAPVTIDPETAALYDVQRTGDTFTFTPKPNAVSSKPTGDSTVRTLAAPAAPGPDFQLFGLGCKVSPSQPIPFAPINLSVPPVITIGFNFSLDLVATPAGIERLVVKGEVKPKIDFKPTLALAWTGEVECTRKWFTVNFPAGGPLGLFLKAQVPVEAGFKLGGKLTVVDVGFSAKAEAKGTVEVGVACEFTADSSGTPPETGASTGSGIFQAWGTKSSSPKSACCPRSS